MGSQVVSATLKASLHQNPQRYVQQSVRHPDLTSTNRSRGQQVSSHDYIYSNGMKKDACSTLHQIMGSSHVPGLVGEHLKESQKYPGFQDQSCPHHPIPAWAHYTKPENVSVV